ncbi:MAG: ABC transporter permease [Kiritimatiellae bacterium]|nr:ABC transporter permease [Kiritimatiellia bacterium]
MSAFLTLWRKELTTYFLSPIAYIVMIFFLVVMGAIFSLLVSVLAEGPAGVTVMNLLFGSPFFWMTMLVLIPLLTMRLFSEEKRSGTIETLMTAPVSDTAVVLAKFAGALSFYIFMWAPTALYIFILYYFSADMAPPDLGPMAGGYLGAILIGMFYLSIGLFCSALTSNQIISAIITFAVMIVLFLTGLLDYVANAEWAQTLSAHLSSYSHMLEFSRGTLDSRPILYYLSGTAVMLFATVKILEARNWK